jgi:peptidoglycan/LPS O-acetylase OafA/YrhL
MRSTYSIQLPERGHQSYRPEIDGLRAIAVMAVVLFHADPRLVRGGFIGVDIFFVISGYLISRIILGECLLGRFSMLGFYVRRIRRIFPALALVIAATLVAGWMLLPSNELKTLSKHLSGGILFASNLIFWSEAGYFDAAAESKPSLHLWSLAVEEQFYIFWPVAVVFAVRHKINIGRLLSLLAISSFAISIYLSFTDSTAAYYSPLSRFWEILAGAGVAVYEKQLRSVLHSHASAWSGLGLTSIAVSLLVISPSSVFPGFWALLPILGACLVIAAGPLAWSNRHLLARRPLVSIGLISYPLYLWHWPIFTFMRLLNDGHRFSAPKALEAIGVSLLAAWCTHVLLERPLRKLLPDRSVARGLFAGMAALLVVCGAIYAAAIPPRNADPMLQAFVSAIGDWDPATYLQKVHEPVPYYRLDVGHPGVETVFIGDSHMEHYRPRLAYLRDHPPAGGLQEMVLFTDGGCMPVPGVLEDHAMHRNCASIRKFAYEYASKPQVRSIVVGACWNCYLTKPRDGRPRPDQYRYYTLVNGQKAYFDEAGGMERAYEQLDGLLASLSAYRDKDIYLVLDNPSGAPYDPRTYFTRSASGAMSLRPRVGEVSRTAEQASVRHRLLEIAARHRVTILDPEAMTCTDDGCQAFDAEGSPLYKDGDHLRPQVVRERAGFLDRTAMARPGP